MKFSIRWLIAITSLTVQLFLIYNLAKGESFPGQNVSKSEDLKAADNNRGINNDGKANRSLLLLDWSAYMVSQDIMRENEISLFCL